VIDRPQRAVACIWQRLPGLSAFFGFAISFGPLLSGAGRRKTEAKAGRVARLPVLLDANNLSRSNTLSVRRSQPCCLILPQPLESRLGVALHARDFGTIVTGGIQRSVSAGTLIIHEAAHRTPLRPDRGRLEVVKGDTVVAIITEPARCWAKCRFWLDQPHRHVRAASDSAVCEIGDAASFLRDQPAVALLIARLLPRGSMSRPPILPTSCSNMPPRRSPRDGREILQTMINCADNDLAMGGRIGNPTQGYEPLRRIGDRRSRPLQRRMRSMYCS